MTVVAGLATGLGRAATMPPSSQTRPGSACVPPSSHRHRTQNRQVQLSTLADSTFALTGIDGGTAMTHFIGNSSIERFPAFRLRQSTRCCC